jgi:hypothetical protein
MFLNTFESVVSNEILLVKRCCINNSTKPTANSTAEKIKKKKVRDKILRLSKAKPTNKAIPYNVIHNSSAVRRR